jgi:hypothetical protein
MIMGEEPSWPSRFGVDHRGYTRFGNDGPYVNYEDFERLLGFAARAMIAGKLIEHADEKYIENIILETIRKNNGLV